MRSSAAPRWWGSSRLAPACCAWSAWCSPSRTTSGRTVRYFSPESMALIDAAGHEEGRPALLMAS